MVYLGIFLIMLYNSLKVEILKKKNLYLILILVVFILAFNYQMGTDWINYQRIYDFDIKNYTLSEILLGTNIQREKGYFLLNYIGNKLNLNYEIFMGILLSWCIIVPIISGVKYTKNVYIFIFVITIRFFIGSALEPLVRQFIAISIVILGYHKIEEKKFIGYLLYILLAVQFHMSAFIGILIYFLNKIEFNIKKTLLLIVLFPILLKFLPIILAMITKIFPLLERYLGYYENIRYSGVVSRTWYSQIYNLSILFFYLYCIFFSEARSQKRYIKNMGILYILIGYYQNILPILGRMQGYFIFGFAIVISYISTITFFNKKIVINKKKIDKFFIILLYILLTRDFYSLIYKNELNIERYTKYKNYFIELILGRTTDDYFKKIAGYKDKIKKLIEEQNKEKKKI